MRWHQPRSDSAEELSPKGFFCPVCPPSLKSMNLKVFSRDRLSGQKLVLRPVGPVGGAVRAVGTLFSALVGFARVRLTAARFVAPSGVDALWRVPKNFGHRESAPPPAAQLSKWDPERLLAGAAIRRAKHDVG